MNSKTCLALVLFWSAGCSALGSPVDLALDIPKGWRAPTVDDLSDEWRLEDASRYAIARGDFDGDGAPDVAALFIGTARSVVGLFVKLSGRSWQLLQEVKTGANTKVGTLGIAVAAPGKYNTYCDPSTARPSECSAEWSSTVVLEHESIDFWKFGSTSWLYVWEKSSKRFVRIAQGD